MELSSYYGSIDLTKLGQIVRQHPELVKVANMKDGTQHQFLNIDISPKQQTDQYGNVAYLKVACKKAEQKQGSHFRPSQRGGTWKSQKASFKARALS